MAAKVVRQTALWELGNLMLQTGLINRLLHTTYTIAEIQALPDEVIAACLALATPAEE